MGRTKLKLRTLLVCLSTGGVLLTSLMILGSVTWFQRQNVRLNIEDNNSAYARKLASTTGQYFSSAEKQLTWSAGYISENFSSQRISAEVERIQRQSDYFNSVVFISEKSQVIASTNKNYNFSGRFISSENSKEAITTQKPLISDPYLSPAGNRIFMISHPVFSKDGVYRGYLGGTVYLHGESMLTRIISQHFYGNDTLVSIFTGRGDIIFKIGGDGTASSDGIYPATAAASKRHASCRSDGQSYDLFGSAYVDETGWEICILSDESTVRRILYGSFLKAAPFIASLVILMFIVVTYVSSRISLPLEKLASITGRRDDASVLKNLPQVDTWYYEAEKLSNAVYYRFRNMNRRTQKLVRESLTDHMTGILNRRGLFRRLKSLPQHCIHGMILIDLDNFKHVNDAFGHDTGDNVLESFARLLFEIFPDPIIKSRIGGEEFVVLLPCASRDETVKSALEFKNRVAEFSFSNVGNVTFSAGVVTFSTEYDGVRIALKEADKLLYQAKNAGRNGIFY